MRIVMLGPFGFHPNKTMRSRAFSLARALTRSGHRVKIVMPPWQTPEEADNQWQEDGVELVYVSLAGGIIPIVGRMVRAARSFTPDVIMGFKPKAYSGLAMFWLWTTRWLHKNTLLVTDTDDWEGWGGWNDIADYSTIQKYFFAWQEKWGMRHCDLLTVASRELGKLATALGAPTQKIVYLPNGPGIASIPIPPTQIAEQKQLHGTTNRPTLLLYSRLFEFDTGRLVAILSKVKQQLPDLAILTVGAGLFAEQSADLRQKLESADLLNSMIDVGWVEEADLPLTLSAGDVGLYLMDNTLLNATKCPVKLADMVALGIPVVAESVGEVTNYIVDEENGRLFISGDVEGISGALVNLLTDQEMAQQLGQNGRVRHEQHFSWAAAADKLSQRLGGLA